MDELERRLRGINLNMLPVLWTILRHRNLTRAARELNLTQSAVSNILKRLRDHFQDELLIRDGRSFRLTERAQRLSAPLDTALRSLGEVVRDVPFDPRTTRHTFRMAGADYLLATILPRMAAMLADAAPRITIQGVAATERSAEHLLSDTIDMVISPRQVADPLVRATPRLRRDVMVEPLIEEPFVCIERADRPESGAATDVSEYMRRPHATFALEINFAASLEQSWLDAHGHDQFNRIVTSEFTMLPLIVCQSDCIALVPRSIAEHSARTMPLRLSPSPIPVPNLEMVGLWNRRRRHEPELTWLRETVRSSLLAL